MANEKPLYTLYKGLKANNYDVPESYDSFERTLTSGGQGGSKHASESRHILYNALKAQNFDVPNTYESFYSTLFEPINTTTSRAKGGYASGGQGALRPQSVSPRATGGHGAASVHVGQPAAPTRAAASSPALPKPLPSGFGRLSIPSSPMPYVDEARRERAKVQGEGALRSWRQRVKSAQDAKNLEPTQAEQRAIDSARAAKKEEQTQQHPYSGAVGMLYEAEQGDTQAQKALSDAVRPAMQQRKDALDYAQATGGEMLRNPVEIGMTLDHEGNVVGAPMYAPTVARDEKGEMILGDDGKPLVGMTTEQAARNTYKSGMEDAVEAEKRRRVEEQAQKEALDLDKATEDMKRIEEEMKDASMGSEEYWMLRAARNAAEDRIKDIKAARDDQNGTFIGGLWRGFRDNAFDISNWNWGFTDTYEAVAKERARVNELLGEGTRASQELARQSYGADMAAAQKEHSVGNGYAWGQIGGQSAPFAVDFLIGNELGVIKGAQGAVARTVGKIGNKVGQEAVKGLSRFGVDVGRRMTQIGKAVVKNTGIAMGDVAASGALSTTIQAPRTGADILSRYTGNATFDPETGKYHFEGGETIGTAIYKGLANSVVENYTEMLGAHLNLGPAANNLMSKVGLKRGSEMIARMTSTDAYKAVSKMMQKAGYNGYLGEVIEEEVGIPLHALTDGSNKMSDLIDPEQQKDIVGGMVFSMGITGGAMVTAHGAAKGAAAAMYYRDKHKLGTLDKVAGYRMTPETWAPIKEALDNAENKDLQAVFNREVMDNGGLSAQGKEAAWQYAQRLILMRGHNIGQQMGAAAAAKDGKGGDGGATQAYAQGYNAADGAADEHGIKVAYEQARDGVAGMYGERFADQLDEDPVGAIQTLEDGSKGQALASEYLQAKVAYEGMIQRAQDDMEDHVQEVTQQVERRVNTTEQGGDGMIHRATLKAKHADGTEHQVYVVNGTVQMTADGKMVDKTRSSASVVVYDPDTGKMEMVSPESIFTVDEAVDPTEELQVAVDAARNQFAEMRANQIDGILDNGHEVFVPGDDGQPVNGVVTGYDAVEGQYMVETEKPVGGNVVQPFAANQVTSALQEGTEKIGGADGQSGETANPESDVPTNDGSNVADGNNAVQETKSTENITAVSPENNNFATAQPTTTVDSEARGAETPAQPEQVNETQQLGQDTQMQESAPTADTPQSAMSRIPVAKDAQGNAIIDKKTGVPAYRWHEASVEDTADALTELNDGSLINASDTAQDMERVTNERLTNLRKRKAAGSDPISISRSRQQNRLEVEDAEKELSHWRKVRDEVNRRMNVAQQQRTQEVEAAKSEEQKAAEEEAKRKAMEAYEERERIERKKAIDRKAKARNKEYAPLAQAKKDFADDPEAMEILNDTEPRDLEETVSSMLRPNSIVWNDYEEGGATARGLQSELGLKISDINRFRNLLGRRENGAKSLAGVAEDIWMDMPEAMQERYTDQDVKNTILDLFGRENSGQMRNVAAENRIEQARQVYERNREYEAKAALMAYAEAHHIRPDEVEDFKDWLEQTFPDIIIDEETLARLDEIFAEQLIEQEEYERSHGMGGRLEPTGVDRGNEESESSVRGAQLGESGIDTRSAEESDPSGTAEPDSGKAVSGDGVSVQEGARGVEASQAEEPTEPRPIGKGVFGNIYDQFKGKAKEAFEFLVNHRTGDLLGVFHREDIGDIDLVWGDEQGGLSHILSKHVGKNKDFETPSAAFKKIENILRDGELVQDGKLRYVVSDDGYRVAIRKDYNGEKKNWIVTALDYNRNQKEKGITTNPTSASHGAEGSEPAAPRNSIGKDSKVSDTKQVNEDIFSMAERIAKEDEQRRSIEKARKETDTNPTEAQKEAGNYKKGHVKVDGMDVTIENAKGSVRSGKDANGKEWSIDMNYDYGYIRGTEGVDGDHIDVYLSEKPSSGNVYVVDQIDQKTGDFDEHKVMYGFPSMEAAREAYASQYKDGWKIGTVTEVSREEFKKWVDSSKRKTKPFAEYSSVKPLGDTQLGEQPTAGYSIEPTTYTNKKGKTTPMHLVTFGKELSKDEIRAGKELAKESRGWWDREKGGFMMRDEDSAKALAVALSNEEAVQDAQPLSVADVATVTDQANMKAVDETIKVEQEPQTTPQYDYDREDDVYDKTLTGLRNVLNDRKRGAIPNIKSIENVIRDLRKRAKTIEDGMATAAGETIPQAFDALANLNGRRKAYEQFLVDIRKKMAETERDDALAAHGVKLGDKVVYKGKEATIYDADARQVSLDVGLAPVMYEVTDWENVELPKPVKEYHGGDRVFSVKHFANKDIFVAHHKDGTVEYTFTDGTKANADEVQDAMPMEQETPQSEQKEDVSEQNTASSEQEQPKQEEKKAKSKWVDDADAERFEELSRRLRMKLGGQLNMGLDPEAFTIGVEMSYLMLKHGARKFGEFATQMIEALGENVRPYLKSFYNGARDLPEMEEYEKELTPYDEVRQFDVMNFDKVGAKDIVATAEHIVREQSAEREAEEATGKIKQERNEQRKENEQQVAADTETVAGEAETVASQVESELEAAQDEQEVNNLASDVDAAIDKVNNQLALLGYYEADHVEADYNEAYGYMRNAEKKAVKNVAALFKTLTEELGIKDPVVYDAKGKKQKSVTANIAPAGGDVAMRFMLNRAKGVELYIDFMLEPDGDSLKLTGIMYRPEAMTPNGGRDYLRANSFFPVNVTVPQMLQGIRSVCQEWLPAEDYVAMAKRIASEKEAADSNETAQKNSEKKNNSKKKSVSLKREPTVDDLFGDLFSNNNLDGKDNEQEVHVQHGPGTSRRREGHQREQNEPLGESKQNEDERPDAGGVVRRSGNDTKSDTAGGSRVSEPSDGKQNVKPAKPEPAPLAESERKNTHNNHAERGTDYAPKGTSARIEANIKAIETMQRLIESGEPATPEDMSVLRKFSGWGGLGAAFKEKVSSGDSGYNPRLRDDYQPANPINARLRELLSPEAYEAANMSRNSAYYTPAPVIDTMWDVARAMGFRGGNVLEGSAGIGSIIGLMPTDMSERSNIHAVEIDETTGNILSLLYPDANVEVKGFEKTFVPNGSVDLAITNVPFVTGLRVMDETGDKDLSRKFHDIHDFCIAKNVRKLKEGGVGIFITSSGTLDSPNSAKLRTWLVNEGGADVVGAFRMHNQTFDGTGATSDIIVIRKRVNGRKSANAIDVSGTLPIRTVKYNTGETKRGSSEVIVKDLALDVNKHFVEHPEDMAGEMAFAFEKGDTYRATSKALYPSPSINQEQRLSEWAQQFKDMDWDKAEERESQQVVYEDLGEDVKEGSMLLDSDGNLCLAQRGKAVPINVNANKVKGHTKAECFNAYKAIKDALADVLEYQTTHSDDSGLQQRLAKLNKAYDSFVKTYGHLNKNTSISFLRSDMDYPSIAALESVSETGDKSGKRIVTYGKTDIFSRRVVETESEPKPTTIKDGIIASIYLNGRVDVPYIAEQLNMSDSDVRQQIIESGLGFENPTTTEMEVSYEYLSGNVREKLRQAQKNNTDGRYDANIKALERVIPMNIPAHLIEFTLGSSWVEPKLYEDFVKERTGLDVKLTNAGGTWIMSEPYYTNTEQNKAMGVISEKCDKTILGHELIKAAITCKSISVTKTISTGYGSSKTTETIVDKEATMACANKIDEIRQDFKDWARGKMQGDPEMSERMERVYNELFNNSVPKEIPDDFVPEHFGGAATVVNGKPFKLRPHQAKAVIRATTQPLMLAHEVGTGKTYTLISTAMEMRRLGTARKPMIVVQNATVGQFVASAKALYPNAKILTLEDADRNAEGRRNFYAKIRYNDWDMIVVPQSVFELIPDSEERQIRFVEDKVEEKMMVLEKMREAANDDRDPVLRQAQRELDQLNDELNDLKLALQERKSGGNTEKDEKREAKTRQNAMVKAQEMLDRETDDVANFDDMGIDALLIDEAHEYKHLGFATAMQRGVKGVDPSYSKKSQGVYLKTQAVLENKNGKNVVFATGTPISNTAAEIWTFMRYLMPADTMREYGIYYFDDFVRNFGNIQQMLEFSTNGKYKENNRFAGYVNLPELVRIWAGVADTVLTREAGGVSDKIPKMEGEKAHDIYLPQTKALRGVMKFVKEQLDDYEKMSGKEKKENSHIPLVMYGIAKAAAVDARLVLEDAADEPNSKTNEAVRQTLRSLEDTKEYNGTVAIFADNYQNKATGFNLYEDIRKKLIDAGVPEAQVVVMKSGMSIKKKLEIFDKVNRGEVRVIMGSTFTLGTGVNIQERLHTLIHVDAPNRPMDYTQRNGRILRQGNLHNEWGIPVRVLRFGVEDSLDVTAYQRLKTKGAIADSIMEGKKMMSNSMENRVLEEEQDLFGDITAQLSGSQYALLKNQVEKEVKKLEARKKQWEADQTYVHNQKPRLKALIKDSEERAKRNKEALARVEAANNDGITIGKMKFPSLDAMGDYIKDYNSKQREQQEQVRTASGYQAEAKSDLTVSVGGFDFYIHRVITKEQKQEKGQLSLSFFSKTQMTYSCPELGLEDVPVDGQRLKSALEDILENVLSGDDFREKAEYADRAAERYKGELQQVEARDGKPFEYADELKQAKEKLAEYEELMKAEMAEKEAKYAEMDKTVEASSHLTEAAEDDDIMMRNGEGELSDDELSFIHDPVAKMLGKSTRTARQRGEFADRQRKSMTARVMELAATLHLDNVKIVTDVAELSGKRARSKGFYNPQTGVITIVIPNHRSVQDVEQTLLHEAVAHYGLRQLFGKQFDTFLDNVFQHAEPEIRREMVALAAKRGWDFRTATEEYLAGLAEDTNFEKMPATFWMKIKRLFLDMLHGLGFEGWQGPELGDNELRYLLWRSYENLKEPGRYRSILGEAADVAKQYELKVGNYEEAGHRHGMAVNGTEGVNGAKAAEKENVVKPVAWGKRDLLSKAEQVSNGIDADLLFRDSIEDDNNTARATYNAWADASMQIVREAWQDSMINVRNLQKAVLDQRGEKLEDWEDAYNEENRSHGSSRAESEYFGDNLYKPLLDAVTQAAKAAKVSLGDVVEYMMAKHGLERNRVFAERDAKVAWEAYVQKKEEAFAEYQAAHKKGRKTLEDFMEKSYEDFLAQKRERDYSGLTALTGVEDVQEAEAEARGIVEDMEEKAGADSIRVLWDRTNAATKWTLRKAYESGVVSKDNYEHVRNMFAYYIPLRGWDEKTAADIYDYVGSGDNGNVFSPTLHTAKGRGSRADNPLAYIGSMAVSAIVEGNKNKVKQSFMRFVKNHPTNLVTVSEMWYVNDGTAEAPVWREDMPDIPEDATADDVARIVREHEEAMKQKEEQGLATKKRGGLHLRVPVKKGEALEHHVEVLVNGKKYVLYINGNPRAAQALNGTRARRASARSVESNQIGRLNRWLGQAYTSLSPAFAARNATRDLTMALITTAIKEDPVYAVLFRMNVARLGGPVRMFTLMRWYNDYVSEHGLTPPEGVSRTKRYFYEFITQGSETGYTSLKEIDDYKKDMEKLYDNMNRKIYNPMRLMRGLAGGMEYANRCIEGMTRFATYKTSRELGRSIRESTSDAKNITLNFNRKGSGELGNATYRNLQIFVNPSIQSLQNVASIARHHPVKFTLYTGLVSLVGFAMPLATQLLWSVFGGVGDDDGWNAVDEYWKLPSWQRRNTFVIWIPGTRKFAMIALAQEYRVFHGFGETVMSVLSGHDEGTPWLELASQALDLLPLDVMGNGGNPLVNFAPTVVQPALHVSFNSDFTGRPLYKDTEYNKDEPAFQKAYVGTPSWLVSSSELLNDVTGGNAHRQGLLEQAPLVGDYLNNPAVVDHLLKGYLGGIYTFLAQLGSVGWTLASGESPTVHDVPVANALVTAPREREQSGKVALPEWYYAIQQENQAWQTERRGFKRDYLSGDSAAKAQWERLEGDGRQQDISRLIREVQSIRTALQYTPEEDEAQRRSLEELLNEVLEQLHAQSAK